MHKSGFVNIIGNPNVGKSTLMNALVGEKLSIITSKAQTTRHRILGIVNGDDFQIVFSDTPGILKPCYKLQESMMNFVRGALSDADVLLYVTDTVERDDERAAEIIDRIRQSGVPTLVVVNKIDLTTQEALEALVEKWRATLPDAEIIPISAREGFNIAGLFDRILLDGGGEIGLGSQQVVEVVFGDAAQEIAFVGVVVETQQDVERADRVLEVVVYHERAADVVEIVPVVLRPAAGADRQREGQQYARNSFSHRKSLHCLRNALCRRFIAVIGDRSRTAAIAAGRCASLR